MAKMLSCILPVNRCHGTNIVTSDCTIVTSGQHGSSIRTTFTSNISTISQNKTIVLTIKLATESIYDYLFFYCLLVCILFEVVRIISLRGGSLWSISGISHDQLQYFCVY